MSESDITIDLSLVDGLRPVFDLLVADLAAVHPFESVADPIDIAAEAAVLAVGGVCGSASLNEAVLRLIRPAATPFERGLAMGMSLVLKARPEAG